MNLNKNKIITYTILILIALLLAYASRSNFIIKKEIENRLSVILTEGTSEADIKAYLDKNRFYYSIGEESICDSEKQNALYMNADGVQNCENINAIAVPIQTKLTLLKGTVTIYLYLDKNKKLETHNSHLTWQFF